MGLIPVREPLDFHDAETALMERIRKQWGALIAEHCAASSVSRGFLAALIAGESGGRADARRFEPHVFGRLLEVCAGKRADYAPAGIKSPLGAQDITVTLPIPFSEALPRVVDLATSHGLTQIMGWHCIEFGRQFSTLATPDGQLRFTLDLLSLFAEKYQLAFSDVDELLRCWNTGRPDGATYDPQYLENARRRMSLYAKLETAAPEPIN